MLDRQEYLPGELREITITISNPTAQTLAGCGKRAKIGLGRTNNQ
jgi:hypothetical protein